MSKRLKNPPPLSKTSLAPEDTIHTDKTIIHNVNDFPFPVENSTATSPLKQEHPKKQTFLIPAIFGGLTMMGIVAYGVVNYSSFQGATDTPKNASVEVNQAEKSLLRLKQEELAQQQKAEEERKQQEEQEKVKAEKLADEKRKQQKELIKQQRQANVEKERKLQEAIETEKKQQEALAKKKADEEKRRQETLAKEQEEEKERQAVLAKKKEEEALAEKKAKEEKQKQASLDKEKIDKEKAAEEKKKKEALAKKLAKKKQQKKKKDLARKKAAQKKRKVAAANALKQKKAAAKRIALQKQQRQKGYIKIAVTLNNKPLKTKIVLTRSGKHVKTITNSYANFALSPGNYVVTALYGGRSSRASVNLGAHETVVQRFAFRRSAAPVRKPAPGKITTSPSDPEWMHTHTN